MIETEKRTTTTQYTEPEFTSFEYGQNSEPEFEIEKQYNFEPNSYDKTESREMEMPTLEKRAEIIAKQEIVAKQKIIASPHLNARGKIIASVFSIIVAIVVAFCIYNAVCINNMKAEIVAKQQIVATQTEVINELEETYNSLGDEDNMRAKLKAKKYKDQTQDDVVIIDDDFLVSVRAAHSAPTNWFEEFCQKLAKLFS